MATKMDALRKQRVLDENGMLSSGNGTPSVKNGTLNGSFDEGTERYYKQSK
jgi:hypothetical protein